MSYKVFEIRSRLYLLRNLCTLLIFLILTESVWHLLDDGGAGVLGDLGADWHLNILGGLHRNLQGNDIDCASTVGFLLKIEANKQLNDC